MKKNKKKYDLYRLEGDFSEFCYRFGNKEEALVSLGILVGGGHSGYIEEISFETVEHVKRIELEAVIH